MDPFLGYITLFAGNFAPSGWALCQGQLLPISQYQALFSLLGTIYGGDGVTTFALPDLRGRVPIHQGTGPGLSPRSIGLKIGTETQTLNISEMPSHNHGVTLFGANNKATRSNRKNPDGANLGNSGNKQYNPSSNASMQTLQSTGGSQSHNNMMPFIAMNYIIALVGIFPSQS